MERRLMMYMALFTGLMIVGCGRHVDAATVTTYNYEGPEFSAFATAGSPYDGNKMSGWITLAHPIPANSGAFIDNTDIVDYEFSDGVTTYLFDPSGPAGPVSISVTTDGTGAIDSWNIQLIQIVGSPPNETVYTWLSGYVTPPATGWTPWNPSFSGSIDVIIQNSQTVAEAYETGSWSGPVPPLAPIPLPAPLMLLVSGFLCLGGLRLSNARNALHW
jgi:hypothetical protein